MYKRMIFWALLATALFVAPAASRARLYNVNTGRFQTMDTFAGNNEDPLSLHKYLYCHDNPINGIDPSGHEYNAIGQVGVMGIQGIMSRAVMVALIQTGATLLVDNFSREQLFLFHVTDSTIVKIAQQYNHGAFRTFNSHTSMFFATTSTHVGSMLIYGLGYPIGIYTGAFQAPTTAGIKAFADDLGVPYVSLPPDLQRPSNKPVIILTSKKGSLMGKIWFNGGISVEGNFYVPLIYSTFTTAPGEMVEPRNYKLIPLP
jgi:hypothetical protein